jgi:HK97 gp10 family phage protein
MAHVDVSEVMAFARDIEQNANRVPARAKVAVQKVGHDTLAVMQAGTPVDTGNLKNSESVDFTGDGLGFEAGPTAEYGVYVEEGTSRMSAEPYAGPAADQTFPLLEDALGAIGDGAFGHA